MKEKSMYVGSLVAVCCLAVAGGGSGVYYYLESSALTERVELVQKKASSTQKELDSAQTALNDAKGTIASLERELQQTKDALAAKDREMEARVSRVRRDSNAQLAGERQQRENLEAARDNENANNRRRGMNLEQLKTENPELYARIQRQREERRQQMERQRQRRSELVAGLNTAKLSAEQRAQVDRYLELQNGGGFNPQTMSREEMQNAFQEARTLNTQVRDMLIDQAVKNGDTAAVQEVIQNFSGGGFGGFGGFGGPPPAPPAR